MMRIITGTARGVKLDTLEGEATRPTAERVKEAVFSSIQFDIAEKTFLDLFAGSGQMGLEAVSRGASRAVLVDESEAAVGMIKKNAARARLNERCRVVRSGYAEFLKSIKGKDTFDYVYIDPPFARRMHAAILKKLADADILNENSLIICEDEREHIFYDSDPASSLFDIEKQCKYGRIYIYYLRLKKRTGEVSDNE